MNSIQSDQIAHGLLKFRITTELSDPVSIARFAQDWSGTAPLTISNTYTDPKNKAFILHCKNNITCTYFAVLNAFDIFLERKEQETKLTKHLTSLRVKKTSEDTVMVSTNLPSIHNEKQLLVTNLIQENFIKLAKKTATKKTDAKKQERGAGERLIKKEKEISSIKNKFSQHQYQCYKTSEDPEPT